MKTTNIYIYNGIGNIYACLVGFADHENGDKDKYTTKSSRTEPETQVTQKEGNV